MVSFIKRLLNRRKKMSDLNTEPFNPCSACDHREACKIHAIKCRFNDAQKELSRVTKNDDSFKAGYVKAVNDYSYWKGGEKYVGHDKPEKLKIVLRQIADGTIKI